MLTESEVWAMEAWLGAAKRWSASTQTMVGAATELTNASRTLAHLLGGPGGPPLADGHAERADLQTQLRLLASTIEDDGRDLRDRYLATQANLELYTDLLG